jgi:hypothetical protein
MTDARAAAASGGAGSSAVAAGVAVPGIAAARIEECR